MVADSLASAWMLTVNVSEAVTKLIDRGFGYEGAREAVVTLPLVQVPFDLDLALLAASLRPMTRGLSFSFADRACLSLAKQKGCPAVTADRAWASADLGIDIELIR